MSYSETKKPLYRKVNTKARGVRHGFGGDFSHVRHAKRDTREQVRGSMHGRKKRGLDYSPLFKFLLTKVGSNWDEVFSEANARIDRPDPIFWLVALTEDQKRELVCMGESSFFTGLYVDESNILQIVNPNFKQEDLIPSCTCCTHTLNGIPISKAE
ncbi:MAG: hypothetical protein IPN60_20870 [Saprospiraceae bacterium]|nr:hypothetical protein [Candidatus Opimibacter skivensis]MBL0007391.1 hypothetical protein [Candidatus Opimibacter skivensis]MBP9745963.1 hypothetical protein [Saprospiraceae bacterium]